MDKETNASDIVNYIFDFLFILDIIIQFRTSYINSMTGDEISSSKQIA